MNVILHMSSCLFCLFCEKSECFFFQYESSQLAVLLYAVGVSEYNLDSIKVIVGLLTDYVFIR